MPEQQNIHLNEVLIRILRGLLQYAGECWPWSDAEQGDEHTAIFQMVAVQQEQVHALSDLLTERGVFIEFGTYPTEYTDLHYVSLDYLLDELIGEQRELIAVLEQAITDCASDSDGQALLDVITLQAKQHLDMLSKLSAARTADSPA